MTAWTLDELLNARRTRKDPQLVISFLTTERLRRFSQMVNSRIAIHRIEDSPCVIEWRKINVRRGVGVAGGLSELFFLS